MRIAMRHRIRGKLSREAARRCRFRIPRTALALLWAVPGCGDRTPDKAAEMVELTPPLTVTSLLASGPLSEPPGEVELFHPTSLAPLGDTIVIADSGNDRVVAVDTGLHVVWVTGRAGAGPGEFRVPYTIRASADAVVVLEMQNARYTELDRSGAYRRTIPSGGSASSFGLASDGAILAPARSATDWVMRRDGETVQPVAARSDTLRGEEARTAMLGSLEPRVAVTVGDTMHVFDDFDGTLMKFAPDGRLVTRRSLPYALLDSMRTRIAERVESLEKQGMTVAMAALSKGLTVTRDGDLFLFLAAGTTTGFLIEATTYAARRIIVPDWTSRWAPLRSAASGVISGHRLFAVTPAGIVSWRIEEAGVP